MWLRLELQLKPINWQIVHGTTHVLRFASFMLTLLAYTDIIISQSSRNLIKINYTRSQNKLDFGARMERSSQRSWLLNHVN